MGGGGLGWAANGNSEREMATSQTRILRSQPGILLRGHARALRLPGVRWRRRRRVGPTLGGRTALILLAPGIQTQGIG